MDGIRFLSWPANLRNITDFQQNQFDIPITGPVECVTTTVVTTRNIMNELCAYRTGKPRLPDITVLQYISELEHIGWRSILSRVPTTFPDIYIPFGSKKINPRGFMHPRYQALRNLKRLAVELRNHYGKSYSVSQFAGKRIEDIEFHLDRGDLVLVSGMFPPIGLEQAFLGGAPHTLGPVTMVSRQNRQIVMLDTGKSPTKTFSFPDFNSFWGRKSRLDLYTKPNTITVVAME